MTPLKRLLLQMHL